MVLVIYTPDTNSLQTSLKKFPTYKLITSLSIMYVPKESDLRQKYKIKFRVVRNH